MIGGGRLSEEIRALREAAAVDAARLEAVLPQVAGLHTQVEALHTHIATLSAQMAALSSQFATELERSSGQAARTAELDRRLVETEQLVAAHVEALRLQAVEIDALRDWDERQDEATRQVQSGLARINRQAAIDFDEMRRTSAALARTVLVRPSSLMTPTGDKGDL